MKLAVFGASGRTGRLIVRQALDAGHDVTAAVRDPARLTISDPSLDVVTADLTDPNACSPHSTAGTRRSRRSAPTAERRLDPPPRSPG